MSMDYGPALKEKSQHYPKRWNGRTPKTIRMLRTVRSDMPFGDRVGPAESGKEYPAYTNSHGAVCAVFPDGKKLGVKPHEFEVVEWFEADGVTVTREEPTPEAPPWTGGPMSIERALEITGACVRTASSLIINDERVPLPKCSLEEMLIANRMVEAHREEPVTKDGVTTTTLHMHVAPGLLAAHYAFEQHDSDPRALLAALGFRLTSRHDAEDEDEDT
jgi:hypothetical protein